MDKSIETKANEIFNNMMKKGKEVSYADCVERAYELEAEEAENKALEEYLNKQNEEEEKEMEEYYKNNRTEEEIAHESEVFSEYLDEMPW